MMPKYNIKVNTWGTKDKTSNGLDNFIEQVFFGGNVGHALIEMTLPNTEKTEEMIKKYCMEETFEEYKQTLPKDQRARLTSELYMQQAGKRIPFQLVKTSNNFARYDDAGVLQNTSKAASETSYYKIDFSFWPGKDAPFYLSNIKRDMVDEREGRHFEYSDRAKEYLQPEERIHKGILGSQAMTYAPMTIVHQRDMNDKQFEKTRLATELQKLTELLRKDKLEELEKLLTSKVGELQSQKIEGTLGLICKNMGLQTTPLVEAYMKENPTETGETLNMDKFKKFLIEKAKEHIEGLKEMRVTLYNQIQDINKDLNFAKIELATELQTLTELLEKEKLLISQVNGLQSQKISSSLSSICRSMGLQTAPLVAAYMNENPTKPDEKVDMDKFKKFLIEKAKEHIEGLKEKRVAISKQIENINKDLNEEEYITRGLPPDHTEELPYLTESGRGFDPEEMLKQMRVLTDPGADAFNLHTKNCSKTCTSILKAGAKHDPLLEHKIGEEALGFFGTPQQVIGNVQRAQEVINKNQQNTLFTRMGNSDMLNRAMGGFITDYRKENLTTGQKAKAIAGIVGIAILKAPEALFRVLINPSQSIADIASGVGTVFKHANSLPLKIVTGILSIIPMAILAPFAIIEKGIGAIVAPFQALSNWINKKPPSPELDGQITSPLATRSKEDGTKDSSYLSAMAILVNAEVAINIRKNTVETSTEKKTAMDILTQFESDLEINKDNVVTLSRKDFDKINKYILETDDPSLSARFQKCCNESLQRARLLSTLTPNAKVAINIRKNTVETSTEKKTAMDILTQFESDLEINKDKVVTLSRKAFDKINKYILEKDDPSLSARFQTCCNESLKRARLLSPLTPKEVDTIVKKAPP